ncbi:MAG: AmmeMemoRadiSam system radical SAM enzyme [Desulfosarcinaceae bacterium]|nr:AmmeMemoRadiSam system radical SAM enzyme [Desulfosarcinaceae bacterium]
MEAQLYDRLENDKVHCRLCSQDCVITPGRRGKCGVRENRDGTLVSLVYGRVIAANVDPIEKKPLYHLLPGSLSFSIATVGCNLRCRFCQNADIAQMPRDSAGRITGRSQTPAEIVAAAKAHDCASIAYTYTEPTIYFEFAHDTAREARAVGLKNVWVTNGAMSADALAMAAPYLDAANVDLKAFSDSFYRQLCGARLDPVLRTLREMKQRGIWVEVTTLLIPGLNDDEDELARLATFIVEDLGPDTPWHVSRFHPTYQLTDRPPTPVETILNARRIGLAAGLRYVYCGNIPGRGGEDTICWTCGQPLVERTGFTIQRNRVAGGRCPYCRASVAGVGMDSASGQSH